MLHAVAPQKTARDQAYGVKNRLADCSAFSHPDYLPSVSELRRFGTTPLIKTPSSQTILPVRNSTSPQRICTFLIIICRGRHFVKQSAPIYKESHKNPCGAAYVIPRPYRLFPRQSLQAGTQRKKCCPCQHGCQFQIGKRVFQESS